MPNSVPSLQELKDQLKSNLVIILEEYNTYYPSMDFFRVKEFLQISDLYINRFEAFITELSKKLPQCPTPPEEI